MPEYERKEKKHMDEKLFFHTVATESAKAYVNSNQPEYQRTGTKGYAKDFAQKYLEAYKVAMDVYNDQLKNLKTDHII